MTDEFLTEGLRDDRYLKAYQLVEQFEDEIGTVLRQVGQRMVEEHHNLFEANIDGNFRIRPNSKTILAYIRVNYPMNGELAPKGDSIQKLNVHLYWISPTQYNRRDVDGTLRAFGYKIKNAPQGVDNQVVEQTHDWPIQTSKNPFDSNVAFYRHVSSAAEIEETADVLVDHFSEFGSEYAIPQDE